MVNILLVVGLVALFITGIVSPRVAGKIEKKTDKEAGWLERMSNWLWDPLDWWITKSTETTRKVIIWTAEKGKKTRRKAKDK